MNCNSFTEAPVTHLPRRERERLQRRADILQAAEGVFAEKGFHSASIETIAREAEYATGTVYLYFKDKEALYIELFEEKIRALRAAIRQRIESLQDPCEALKQLVQARMAFFEQNRKFFSIYAREGMNVFENRDDRWSGVVRLYEDYLATLTNLIRAGQRQGALRKGKPRDFALALSGMMIQLTRDWLQRQDKSPLTGRSRFVFDLFLKGARTL